MISRYCAKCQTQARKGGNTSYPERKFLCSVGRYYSGTFELRTPQDHTKSSIVGRYPLYRECIHVPGSFPVTACHEFKSLAYTSAPQVQRGLKTLKKQLKPSRTTNIFYTSKLRLSVFRGTCRRMTHKNNGLPKRRPYHANVKFWSHSSILTQGRIGTFVLIFCIGPWGMTLVSIIYAVIWSGRFLLYGGRYVQE